MGGTRTRYDLDQSFVDRLKATTKIAYYWDLRQRGLFVRVTPKGSRSYGLTLQRANTQKVHMTLGACSMPGTKGQKEGALSLAVARQKAGDLIQKHKDGRDVLSEVAKIHNAYTLQSLVELWQETEAPKLKPSTLASYLSIIHGVILPAFGKRLVSGLSFEEISKWFAKLSIKTPVQANRASWILQGLLRLAESLDQIPRGSNPCIPLTRTKEAPRKRILSAEELRKLEMALQALMKRQALNPYHADLVRLICLTGLRRGEALGLKFSDVDTDRRVIRFMEHKTDDEGTKLIPINSHAAALLRRLA